MQNLLTKKQAIEKKLKLPVEWKKPVKCKFCKELREYVGFEMSGEVHIIPVPVPCKCKESNDYIRLQKQKEEAEKIQKQRELDQQAFYRRLDQSFIEKRFKNKTFENFEIKKDNKSIYDCCLDYSENFLKHKDEGLGLYLYGGVGVGKTHLAAAITLNLITKGYKVIIERPDKMNRRLRSTFNNTKYSELELLNMYSSCDLLIINDLGKGKMTEWAIETLFSIIDDRYEANLPTIITTQYKLSALKQKLTIDDDCYTADAIIDRIIETCKGLDMTSLTSYRRNLKVLQRKESCDE